MQTSLSVTSAVRANANADILSYQLVIWRSDTTCVILNQPVVSFNVKLRDCDQY